MTDSPDCGICRALLDAPDETARRDRPKVWIEIRTANDEWVPAAETVPVLLYEAALEYVVKIDHRGSSHGFLAAARKAWSQAYTDVGAADSGIFE